jgi:hypothetical protein
MECYKLAVTSANATFGCQRHPVRSTADCLQGKDVVEGHELLASMIEGIPD